MTEISASPTPTIKSPFRVTFEKGGTNYGDAMLPTAGAAAAFINMVVLDQYIVTFAKEITGYEDGEALYRRLNPRALETANPPGEQDKNIAQAELARVLADRAAKVKV